MKDVLLSLHSRAQSLVPRAALAGLALVVLLPLTGPAEAAPFTDGEFVTYDQNVWGADPADGPPSSILRDHFFDVFTNGAVFGDVALNSMDFSGADAMLTYLPQSGPPAA